MVLWNMNSRHSKVTDWGLSQASIGKQDIILDVGCGGGRTVSKLAAIATQGKVYGIDHSTESVAMAMRTNKQWINIARVEIREAFQQLHYEVRRRLVLAKIVDRDDVLVLQGAGGSGLREESGPHVRVVDGGQDLVNATVWPPSINIHGM
jgi:precorrin-6B methylase 2